MFTPRTLRLLKPQKHRSVHWRPFRLWRQHSLQGWVRLVTLGPGRFAAGTLSRLFIYAKHACRAYKMLRRF
jgi:hypothetical protein